jgi:hypothetical protein
MRSTPHVLLECLPVLACCEHFVIVTDGVATAIHLRVGPCNCLFRTVGLSAKWVTFTARNSAGCACTFQSNVFDLLHTSAVYFVVLNASSV